MSECSGYDFLTERTCKQCGKTFGMPNPSMWTYKKYEYSSYNRTVYFCSWSCIRAYEKGKKKPAVKTRPRKQKEKVRTSRYQY